ncbi:MAG: hypothetical protein ACP5HM_01390, partial [Anaerolineae bacterium]
MENRDEITERTTDLARRIAHRWRPTLTMVGATAVGSVGTRLQRTVAHPGVLDLRVQRLPVVRMAHDADRHLARFPLRAPRFEPRPVTPPEASPLPLVGAPQAPPETPVQRTAGADEEPEWLKRLPSFAEATSRLRFPDSVDVKLPEPRPQQTPPSTPEKAPTSESAASPSQTARRLQRERLKPPEQPTGPRRMRVMTQVEEFTSGRRPPPVSLQDLRRVRVGEPQPSKPKAPLQRAPAEPTVPTPEIAPPSAPEAQAEDTAESRPAPPLQRAPAEPTVPTPEIAPPSAPEAQAEDTAESRPAPPLQRTPAEPTVPTPEIAPPSLPEAQAEGPAASQPAPPLQRAPAEATAPAPETAPPSVAEAEAEGTADSQPTPPLQRAPAEVEVPPPAEAEETEEGQ